LDTYVERSKAVPAEDVFAPLAHHLGAALVLLDGHLAHRAVFDSLGVEDHRSLASANAINKPKLVPQDV